jgi:hypothetical protein
MLSTLFDELLYAVDLISPEPATIRAHECRDDPIPTVMIAPGPADGHNSSMAHLDGYVLRLNRFSRSANGL